MIETDLIERSACSRAMRRLATRVFVDGVWMHRGWRCHNLPERSFALSGRQFHLCARCTGLVTGVALSWCLLPIRHVLPPVLLIAMCALAIDGFTQMLGWRHSTNTLRLTTGLGVGLTLLPALIALGRL
jgi:uncharacterized membrane protein